MPSWVCTYLGYALIRAELVNKLCRLSQVSIGSLCSIVLLSYVQDRTLSIHDLHALCIKVSRTTSFPVSLLFPPPRTLVRLEGERHWERGCIMKCVYIEIRHITLLLIANSNQNRPRNGCVYQLSIRVLESLRAPLKKPSKTSVYLEKRLL